MMPLFEYIEYEGSNPAIKKRWETFLKVSGLNKMWYIGKDGELVSAIGMVHTPEKTSFQCEQIKGSVEHIRYGQHTDVFFNHITNYSKSIAVYKPHYILSCIEAIRLNIGYYKSCAGFKFDNLEVTDTDTRARYGAYYKTVHQGRRLYFDLGGSIVPSISEWHGLVKDISFINQLSLYSFVCND